MRFEKYVLVCDSLYYKPSAFYAYEYWPDKYRKKFLKNQEISLIYQNLTEKICKKIR